MGDPLLLTVGDVKQYFYCPRIVYYNYLMPGFRPVTYKMEEGKLRQKEEERLEKRRTLTKYEIASGRKSPAMTSGTPPRARDDMMEAGLHCDSQ